MQHEKQSNIKQHENKQKQFSACFLYIYIWLERL